MYIMKKYIAMVLLLCIACTVIPSCSVPEKESADNSALPFSIKTVTPPEPRSTVVPLTDLQASAHEPSAIILTEPYINRYTLNGSLDFEAFVEYLSEYYAELYGEQLVICISDMIDHGDTADGRGVVTVLAEYHSWVSLETGRNDKTLCGWCNFFFSYDASTGMDFVPQPFVGDNYLHNRSEPTGNDFSEYTATVDTHGYVQLVKAGHSVITTPAKFCWELFDFDDLCHFYIDGNDIVLVLRENNGEYGDGDWTEVRAYASQDGGVTWSSFSLDYTPTTTTNIFEVTSLVLNMIDGTRGTVVLSTPRCEVFFYVTDDSGVTWEKRRNFKLLNYRIDGLHTGGLIDDELGFISFIARDGKNPNVYITYDGGRNWSLMDIAAPDGCSDEGAYAGMAYIENGAVILPIVYEDGVHEYISRDGGATWNWKT